MPPAKAFPPHLLARRRQIGARIRTARIHANLTQERLAERCELDRQAIGFLEAGHSSPLLDTLLRIADALDTPLADLVRYDDEAPTASGG